MNTHTTLTLWPCFLLLSWSSFALGRVYEFPPRSPASETVERLVIYSSIDIEAARPLVESFQGSADNTEVSFHSIDTAEQYARFVQEYDQGSYHADILLSSAMDLQIKLANDGYIRDYDSFPARRLPSWATWRNEVFGFSYEPAVIVYNRTLVDKKEVPKTHTEFITTLSDGSDKYFRRITTYDPTRSGLGFLFATQDAKQGDLIWPLVAAMGNNGVKLYTNTAAMLDHIASGKFLLGYNLLGSYALARSRQDSSLGIVFPEDYTLVMQRTAALPKKSPNPRSAEKFLDYLLSKHGQQVIANESHLYAIRADVEGPATASLLQAQVNRLKPIKMNAELLVYLDQVKRQLFLSRWQYTLSGGSEFSDVRDK